MGKITVDVLPGEKDQKAYTKNGQIVNKTRKCGFMIDEELYRMYKVKLAASGITAREHLTECVSHFIENN